MPPRKARSQTLTPQSCDAKNQSFPPEGLAHTAAAPTGGDGARQAYSTILNLLRAVFSLTLTGVMALSQIPLLCGCGSALVNQRGVCPQCNRRERLSHEQFAGQREQILRRDENRCQICAALDDLVCHHRRPAERKRGFVTLCRGDHTRLHKLYRLRFGLPRKLQELWRELNPEAPEQLELIAIERPPRQEPLFG